MPQKVEKEEDLLKELCGDDTELYDVLCHFLRVDPISGISGRDLAILIEEAEKSVSEENYGDARRKYRTAVDKAIFEATQNPLPMGRYKVIQDLASKTAKATEKVKENAEKEGLAERASQLEREIKNYGLLSKRIEDVIKIASLYYIKRLEELKEGELREGQRRVRGIEVERKQRAKEKEA